MTKAEREEKRQHWRAIVEQWSASGLSKAAFCRENELPAWQFHYWHGRFRENDQSAGFARVDRVPGSGVHLRLPNGLLLELTGEFDESILARFLSVASRTC